MLLLEDTFATELRLEVKDDDRLVIASHLDEEVVELWDRHDLLILSAPFAQREGFLEGSNRVTLLPLLWRLLCGCCLVVLVCGGFGDFCLLCHRVNSNLIKVSAEKLDELPLLLEVVRDALGSQLLFLLICGANTTGCHLVGEHEGDQAKHDSLHGPARIPRFRVIIAEASANGVVDLKPALRSVELDSWRLERVVSGEEQSAPVESTDVRTLLESKD